MKEAEVRAKAKYAAYERRLRGAVSLPQPQSHVFAAVDDCPADWGAPRVLAVFADREAANDFVLREKGKNPVAVQYYEVQRRRVQ